MAKTVINSNLGASFSHHPSLPQIPCQRDRERGVFTLLDTLLQVPTAFSLRVTLHVALLRGTAMQTACLFSAYSIASAPEPSPVARA